MTTFLFTGSVQSFTVPVTGQYDVLCAGAQGGNTTRGNPISYGGLGAVVENFFMFQQGQVLDFVVGGKGNDGVGAGGGGGGSFVYIAGSLIEAAGGGGGAGSDSNGSNAQIFSDSIDKVATSLYGNTVDQRVITGMNGSTGLVADVSYGAAGSGGVGGLGGGGGAGQWGGGGGGAGWGGDGFNGGSWGLPDFRVTSIVYEPPTYSHHYGGQGGAGKLSFMGGAGSIDSQAGSGGFGGGGGAGVNYAGGFGYSFWAGGGGGGFSGGGGGQASGGGGGGSFVLNSAPYSNFDSARTNAGNGLVMINLTREYLSDRHLAYDTDAYENAGAVVRLYNAALARPHDHEGAGYWVKALDKGTALSVVADAILKSEEYNFINGGNQTNAEFVEMLYNNALHRNPDQAGEAFWLSLLDSGTASRADVLIDIGESAESIEANAVLVANGVLFQEWL